MSPPAENALSPAPVMTRQPISSSTSSVFTASSNSTPSLRFMALRTCGLLSVTMPTPSSRATRMCSYGIDLVLLFRARPAVRASHHPSAEARVIGPCIASAEKPNSLLSLVVSHNKAIDATRSRRCLRFLSFAHTKPVHEYIDEAHHGRLP